MDRPATCALDHPTAVRTAESAALDLLLPAAAGERREPAPDAAARRAVSGMSLLRQPPHGGDAGGEPQTRPAAHGDYGNRSSLSETELEPPGAGSRDLPIPAARPVDRAAQPGLEHRYYIYSDAWRVPLPGRCHGLVQPLRAELGTLRIPWRPASVWLRRKPRSASANPRSGTPIRVPHSPPRIF